MRAYKIFRDKKTENYVLLYFLFSVISYFLSMFWPDEGTVDRLEQMGRESFATNLLVFQLALSIIILLVILPKLVTYIYTDEYKIRKGAIFPQVMNYGEIRSIDVTDECIVVNSIGMKMRIKLLDFDNNTESYSDIIDRIVTRAELKVTKDQIINTAEEKYKSAYKTPGKSPIAIDGWIKLLLIHFIALFLSSIIQLTGITANNYSDNATIKPLFIASAVLMTIIYGVMIAALLSKNRKAPTVIIALLWIDFALKIMFIYNSGLVYWLTQGRLFISSGLPILIPSAVVQAMLILVITRYFKVSRRAAVTFTKEKLFEKTELSEAYAQKAEAEKKPKKKKIIILVLIFIILPLLMSICSSAIREKAELARDTNVYASPEKIIAKYKYDGARYICDAEYGYILYRGEKYSTEELILEREPGEYIIFNEWMELRRNAKEYYEYPIVPDFPSSVTTLLYDNKYIILIERWQTAPECKVYDMYGEWEGVAVGESEYYFNVLDSSEMTEEYEIYVEVHGESALLIDKNGMLGNKD